MRPINFYWPLCPLHNHCGSSRLPSPVSSLLPPSTSALQRVNYASGAIKAKPERTKFIGCHALISIQMRRPPTRSRSLEVDTVQCTRMRTQTNSLTAPVRYPAPIPAAPTQHPSLIPHYSHAHNWQPRSMGGPWRWINNKVTTTKNNRAGDGASPRARDRARARVASAAASATATATATATARQENVQ